MSKQRALEDITFLANRLSGLIAFGEELSKSNSWDQQLLEVQNLLVKTKDELEIRNKELLQLREEVKTFSQTVADQRSEIADKGVKLLAVSQEEAKNLITKAQAEVTSLVSSAKKEVESIQIATKEAKVTLVQTQKEIDGLVDKRQRIQNELIALKNQL